MKSAPGLDVQDATRTMPGGAVPGGSSFLDSVMLEHARRILARHADDAAWEAAEQRLQLPPKLGPRLPPGRGNLDPTPALPRETTFTFVDYATGEVRTVDLPDGPRKRNRFIRELLNPGEADQRTELAEWIPLPRELSAIVRGWHSTPRREAPPAAGGNLSSKTMKLSSGAVDPGADPMLEGFGTVEERARRGRRAERYGMRAGLRTITKRKSVQGCGLFRLDPSRDIAAVQLEGKPARYENVRHCGCGALCPVCSLLIRNERRAELVRIITEHRAVRWAGGRTAAVDLVDGGESGSMLMGALTLPHRRWMDPVQLVALTRAAWKRMKKTRGFAAFAARWGLVHWSRAFEVTHGQRNGMHPHFHPLWLLSRSLNADQVELFSAWLARLWCDAVQAEMLAAGWTDEAGRGLRPDPEYCESELLHNDEAVARYLVKAGYELTASDTKEGRRGNRSMWEVLRDLVRYKRPGDFRTWWEWEAASRGANIIRWSNGAKRFYGLAEVSDEELCNLTPEAIAERAMKPDPSRTVLGRVAWRAVTSIDGADWALLDAVEMGDGEFMLKQLVRLRREAVTRRTGLKPLAALRGELMEIPNPSGVTI